MLDNVIIPYSTPAASNFPSSMSVAKRLKTMLTIGTHNGTFHADESLAVYMLKLLPKYRDAEIIRTRDMPKLEECDIVVDVSGKYEPPRFLDHHQRGFNETFDENHKTKLSSAGLVYKHFGKDVLKELLKDDEDKVAEDEKSLEILYQKIYNEFIEAIDANDNGISAYPEDIKPKFKANAITLPGMVSGLNPLWREPSTDEVFDKQFFKASKLMGEAFERTVYSYGKGWYPAKKHVNEAFSNRIKYDPEGRIVVFDTFVPWKDHIFNIEIENDVKGQILYVLYEDSNSAWRVQCVPESAGSFNSRKPLPEKWRGLRDDKLAEVSNIPGAIFVHAAGFIGGAQTFEGALEMAKKSLDI